MSRDTTFRLLVSLWRLSQDSVSFHISVVAVFGCTVNPFLSNPESTESQAYDIGPLIDIQTPVY